MTRFAYGYAYSNPVLFLDPSGRDVPDWLRHAAEFAAGAAVQYASDVTAPAVALGSAALGTPEGAAAYVVASVATLAAVDTLGTDLDPVYAAAEAADGLVDETSSYYHAGQRVGRTASDAQSVYGVLGGLALMAESIPTGAGGTLLAAAAGVTGPQSSLAIEGVAGSVAVGELVAGAGVAIYSGAVFGHNRNTPIVFSQGTGGDGGRGSCEPGTPLEFDALSWHPGADLTPEEAALRHFWKHGAEVGGKDVQDYIRKAEAFRDNLKRARPRGLVSGYTEGVRRWVKGGKYIDLAPDGRIVSYGLTNSPMY